MTLARLWAFLAIALPMLGALVASLSTVDLAYHLRAGAEITSTLRLPATDTYTFTLAGTAWVDQQWGAQVLLSSVYAWFGWSGLFVLRALLIGITFGAVYLACRISGTDERRSALLALGAFLVASPALALRPQLLGMTLFALALLVLAARHRAPRALAALPLIALVWANVHGSFVLAPAAVGAAWLVDVVQGRPAARATLVALVACAVATVVTPFGPSVWAYALALSGNPVIADRVAEWRPTSLRDLPGVAFFASALTVCALFVRRGASAPWPVLAWTAFLFLMGAYAVRGVAWWPIGAAVVCAGLLADARPRVVRPGLRRVNAGVAIAVAAAGVVLLPVWRSSDPLLGPAGLLSSAPAGITRALVAETRPGDRLYHPQTWGSWLEFALPHTRVVADSRIELFPASVWEDIEAVERGAPGWESILSDWSVDFAVVAAAESAGLEERLQDAGWSVVYAGEDGWVLRSPDAGA